MRKQNERAVPEWGISVLADLIEVAEGWVRGNKGGGGRRENKAVRRQRGKCDVRGKFMRDRGMRDNARDVLPQGTG